MRSSKLVAVLSKPQTNKVRSCVIIKEIEDGGSRKVEQQTQTYKNYFKLEIGLQYLEIRLHLKILIPLQ